MPLGPVRPTNFITNLPAEPNDFIGRERDLTDLARLLEAARAVTLCGPGGIGKTRLALRIAAEAAERFDDGCRLVEFADLGQPELVPRRVAAAFGVGEETGRPLADTLADVLAPCRTLLVLDNCEHLIDACADLGQALLAACPGLRVLTTSREPLRISGEAVWRVPPLTVPPAGAGREESMRHEAVRLFLARAAGARPGFALTEDNTGAIVRLCRALDGVPLAIELAAARVRVLSAEQISARLTDRFRLLAAGQRTAPPRQRTLRATIDWSHDLLTEPEQILLRRLSVFAGWALGQAEQVCAHDPQTAPDPHPQTVPADAKAEADLIPDDVLDLLTALVDKSLVVVDKEVAGETGFRLLESIRQYAAERLEAAGEAETTRRRHRDTILEAAELHGEIAMAERTGTWAERIELFRRYDAEQGNVRAALAWSLERGEAEEAMRLCTALRSYWIARGYFAEWARWLDRALATPAAGTVSAGVRGAALVGRAQLALDQRDLAVAATAAGEGLRLCRASADEIMIAAALGVIAQLHVFEGRYADAAPVIEEGLAIARAGGDRWNEALLLTTSGSAAGRQGKLREAQQLLEGGLALFHEIDQQFGAARALSGLGMIAQLRGDHEVAERYYAEALPILRGIEAGPETARCLGGIGRVRMDQDDLDRAREVLGESLTLSRSSGTRLGVARALESLASLAARDGEGRLAVRLGGAAARLREEIGLSHKGGARLEQILVPVRKQLGEPLVAQSWGEGREMTVDEAIEAALAITERSPGEPEAVSDPAPRPHLVAAPVSPPSTLTPREHEIARLIARGLSNRGIANELVISPATVARHVTNILTKLGFASRSQVAAWAVDHEPQ